MQITYRTLLFLLFTISPHISAQPLPDDGQKIKRIDASFVNLCQTNKFSGAILIAINGQIRFEKACGLANREFNVANTIETKFNLGSVGKLFTSIAITQLIETKKLRPNQRIVTLIPSWLKMANGKAITIKQLLTHTAGLGNFMEDKRWQLGGNNGFYLNTDDYLPLIASKKLFFKPGQSQIYSNSGYLILGAVIEKLSNESYPAYLKKHIFDAANMRNSGIAPLDAVVKNRALGYFEDCQKKGLWKNNNFAAPFIGTAAGGAYSTVGDLFKFSQYLFEMNKQALSPMLTQPKEAIHKKILKIGDVNIPENFSPYGFAGAWNKLGFAVWSNPSLLGHTGGTKGAAALFAISPDNQYTIIILSNQDNGTTLLYQKIRKALEFKGELENL